MCNRLSKTVSCVQLQGTDNQGVRVHLPYCTVNPSIHCTPTLVYRCTPTLVYRDIDPSILCKPNPS